MFSVLDNNKVYQKTLDIKFRQEGLTAAVVVAVVPWRSPLSWPKNIIENYGTAAVPPVHRV